MTPFIGKQKTTDAMNVINDSMKNIQTGFTLAELMITLVIASLIISLAMPSFNSFLLNNRFTTQANTFITAINLARSEAVKRGITITVCSSNNQTSCTTTAWQNGWIITDTASGEVFRIYDSLKGSSSLDNTEGNTSLAFTADGFYTGTSTTFTLCDSSVTGETGRRIFINSTGRPNSVSPPPTCS